jgi:hypothetical protein
VNVKIKIANFMVNISILKMDAHKNCNHESVKNMACTHNNMQIKGDCMSEIIKIKVAYINDIIKGGYLVQVKHRGENYTFWSADKPIITTENCTVGDFAESK